MTFESCAIGKTYHARGVGTTAFTATTQDFDKITDITINGDGSVFFQPATSNSQREYLFFQNNGANFVLSNLDSFEVQYTMPDANTSAASQFLFGTGSLFTTGVWMDDTLKVYIDGTSSVGSVSFADDTPVTVKATVDLTTAGELTITAIATQGATTDTVVYNKVWTASTQQIGYYDHVNNDGVTINYIYAVGTGLSDTCIGQTIPRLPQMGYSTQIKMLWDVNVIADNTIHVYDYGSANDQYTCDYRYIRETTEAEELATLAEVTYRGASVPIDTLHGITSTDFFPFGPHITNSNPDVRIMKFGNVGQVNPFGVIHAFDMQIAPDEVLTFDSVGTVCFGGGFRFGGLLDIELPTMEPVNEYKVNSTRLGRTVNQNYNPQSSQHRYCRLTWTCEKQTAINILVEALVNQRSLTFTMNAGANHYPFGVDAGQGDFTVRISNPVVEVEHLTVNTFRISIEVVKC